jgi:hypothetical protein
MISARRMAHAATGSKEANPYRWLWLRSPAIKRWNSGLPYRNELLRSQELFYFCDDEVYLEWLWQDRIKQIRSLHTYVRLSTAHQDDWQMIDGRKRSHSRGELQAVHDGHHEVGNNQGWTLPFENFEALSTIAGFYDHEAFILQREAENVSDQILVVDDQDGGHVNFFNLLKDL